MEVNNMTNEYDKNSMNVTPTDKNIISILTALPREKQALVKGVILGLNLAMNQAASA